MAGFKTNEAETSQMTSTFINRYWAHVRALRTQAHTLTQAYTLMFIHSWLSNAHMRSGNQAMTGSRGKMTMEQHR